MTDKTPEHWIVVLRSTNTERAHRTGESACGGAPSAVDTEVSPLGGCGRYSALTAANGRRKYSLKAHGRVRFPKSQTQRHGHAPVAMPPLVGEKPASRGWPLSSSRLESLFPSEFSYRPRGVS